MSGKIIEIGKAIEKFDYVKTEKGEKSYQDLMDKLDELEAVNNQLVKASRLKGITEGFLGTLGILIISGLVINAISRKDG